MKREVVEYIYGDITATINRIKLNIARSYSRGKPCVNDIDIVISKGNYLDVWREWRKQVPDSIVIHDPYSLGDSKIGTIFETYYMGHMYRLRVDIFLAKASEWVFTVLYATGSGDFNIMMRAIAKKKGYLLNQRCLYKKKCIPVKNEREIFDILGIDYVSPHMRN
jgi:DNA polymerase/3'-5' exonuclease PolX